LTRVAFVYVDARKWTGGYNYFLNLLRAIACHASDKVTPVLFCGTQEREEDLLPFRRIPGVEVVPREILNPEHAGPRLMEALVRGLDSGAVELFRELKIDVILEHAAFYGRNCPIPSIAWFPDFQHRKLRDYFGFKPYWRRELGFRTQVRSGRSIMLSSEDARKDCEEYYPGSIGRIGVVRFSSHIESELLEGDPRSDLASFGISEPFFYLPNQFWKHKNHVTVVRALQKLKSSGCGVRVICTGNPVDPRHPRHYQELNDLVDREGLRENFRILGVVSRRQVLSLMRLCRALINPSLFEGWSSTVEEGRALNTPMVLSGLGVHREQMGEGAAYFDPLDADQLADRLRDLHETAPVSSAPRGLSPDAPAALSRFAGSFAQVVWDSERRFREAAVRP
jgi:glycosyltransferase involved in cell wall biosynthesis